MKKIGLKPKKSLGQNFLVNKKIYQFIAEEIAPQKGEVILEVGPGEGILTSYLAESGAEVIAVEKDRRLIPILKEKFKSQKNVIIIEGDILKFDPLNYNLKAATCKLVGNIPYYLTSYLLRIVLEEWPKPKLILFMVQKEVAKRIVAKPSEMSLLALAVQFFATAKIIRNVSKNNFRPAPKVDSALIKIIPKTVSYSKEFQKKFFELAHAAFENKRKQILNSLVKNLKLEKDFITQKLAEVKIEPNRRPETLSLEEWEKLTKLLFSESPLD